MLISNKNKLSEVLKSVEMQASALLSLGKYVDVSVKEHIHKRSLEQNAFLWILYDYIVNFWEETGFMIDGLDKRIKYINSDFLHAYFKIRFNVKTTTKLSTKDFSEYVDKIQKEMSEQSFGEYQPIVPEIDLEKKGYVNKNCY